MIMGAYLYNRTKPDGTSIGLFGGSHLQAGIIGPGVEYDIAKMPIIRGVRGVRIGIVRDFLKADSRQGIDTNRCIQDRRGRALQNRLVLCHGGHGDDSSRH